MKEFNIAIIPARLGSKGIPRKNLKKLGGIPLIDWTIHAAFNAGNTLWTKDELLDGGDNEGEFAPLFDRIVVTSESEEILNHAINVADTYEESSERLVIFERDPQFALDHVQTDEVCLDVLRSFEYEGQVIDNICLLQPTSPFRTDRHINESFGMWQKSAVSGSGCLVSGARLKVEFDGYLWSSTSKDVVSVEPVGHDPQYRLGRQWEPPLPNSLFVENGALYWFDADEFSLKRSYRQPPYIMYEMEESDSIDINTIDDWDKAEKALKEMGWKSVKPRS